MQQPSWMAEAWRELGQSERPGPTHNQRIVAMFDELGHPNQADETAWCAAFVGACLERAGIASTRSLRARSYEEWGVPSAAPTAGAVAVLRRGSDPVLGHVGFLVGATDTHVVLLGGNQSDAVTVASFDRDLVLGYRAPPTAGESLKADPHFEAALRHVLDMEGGWSDDPHDPGGPTNKGITLAVYARERGIDVTPENFAALKAALQSIPDSLVRDIYVRRYWHPAHCAALRSHSCTSMPPSITASPQPRASSRKLLTSTSTARSARSPSPPHARRRSVRPLRATATSGGGDIARSRTSGASVAGGCGASTPRSPPPRTSCRRPRPSPTIPHQQRITPS